MSVLTALVDEHTYLPDLPYQHLAEMFSNIYGVASTESRSSIENANSFLNADLHIRQNLSKLLLRNRFMMLFMIIRQPFTPQMLPGHLTTRMVVYHL